MFETRIDGFHILGQERPVWDAHDVLMQLGNMLGVSLAAIMGAIMGNYGIVIREVIGKVSKDSSIGDKLAEAVSAGAAESFMDKPAADLFGSLAEKAPDVVGYLFERLAKPESTVLLKRIFEHTKVNGKQGDDLGQIMAGHLLTLYKIAWWILRQEYADFFAAAKLRAKGGTPIS